jgi:hypothetical protein
VRSLMIGVEPWGVESRMKLAGGGPYTLPCLPSMVDISDSRRFGLRLLSDLFLNSFHSDLGVALRLP